MSALLDLADYRRRVAASYAAVRNADTPYEERWRAWVAARDVLLGRHAQSALDPKARARFAGLPYFSYRSEYRVLAEVDEQVEAERFEVRLRDDGQFAMRRAALLRFTLPSGPQTLSLYRIEGYGGGLFLPFRDATSGIESYGGGRYLLDTQKYADLGAIEGRLLLDFNYAYHPSCFYSVRWDCPLAPLENRLGVPIAAGERLTPLGN
jgi:uncharacterized protein (DUF1684 family)